MSPPGVLGDMSSAACDCDEAHRRRRVVLTGGPGAGKTAVLELIRHSFCRHVLVLPESAGVVFGGGFPRERQEAVCARSGQRAIYFVQRELEACADAHNPAVVLCDRGTLDGIAYWPRDEESFWSSLGTSEADELGRYDTVIQLRTPTAEQGYNHRNPLRTESAASAAEIDERILSAWSAHPHRFVVEASASFLDKASRALELLRHEVPGCCAGNLSAASVSP